MQIRLLVLTFCIAAAPAISGCFSKHQKERLASLAADAPASASRVKTQTRSDRAAFQNAAEEKLNLLSGRIDALRQISSRPGPSFGLRSDVEMLEDKRMLAEKKLFNLKLAPEPSWAQFREDVDTALFDLEDAYLDVLEKRAPTPKSTSPELGGKSERNSGAAKSEG